MLLAGLLGLPTATGAASSFVGTWEGKINDLPGIEIKVNENKKELSGSVVFFFQRRGEDGKWRIEGEETEVPMLAPRIDGTVLSFEVIHYKTHGGAELGANAKFRMELIGSDQAILSKVEGKPAVTLKLTRRKSRN
jgi:hypothetical protein